MARLRKAHLSDLASIETAALAAELRMRDDFSGRVLAEGEATLDGASDDEFTAEAEARKLRVVDERDIVIEDFDELRSLAVRKDWQGLLRAIETHLPHELQGLEAGIFGIAISASSETEAGDRPAAVPESFAPEADLFG